MIIRGGNYCSINRVLYYLGNHCSINRFPDIASRILEASYLCGLDEVSVSVAMKPYTISLLDNEMVDTKKETKWKIRRTVQLEPGIHVHVHIHVHVYVHVYVFI